MVLTLNGKANKLTKLVLEQRSNEPKILTVGETWDMGGGYTLKVQSIDARASPRQAWVVFSKDGGKLDDKVIEQGNVYTYVQYSLAGETDAPLFVTYIDSVFAGTTTDFVILKYTWLMSKTVTEVRTDDRFGLLRVIPSSGNEIKFDNDYTISLAPNATINLAGNIKFKVTDNTTYLKFYPTIEPRLNVTASSVSIPAGTPTDVIFTVTSNDSPINGATVSLSGAAVESGITGTDGKASININATYNGTIIAEAGEAGHTNGTTTIQAHLLPVAAMASWNLQEDYILNLTDIDARATPRQARLQLSKNGIVIKDSMVTQGNVFEYCPTYNCTFNATVDVIFNGETASIVKLKEVTQYSETSGAVLLNNSTHSFIPGIISRTDKPLDEDYTIALLGTDIKAVPRMAWLRLYRNNTMVDEKLAMQGDIWYYNLSNKLILYAEVNSIFAGVTANAVQLKNVTQYSEMDGSILISGNYTLTINALPTPILTQIPISSAKSRYVWDAALGANLTYEWTPMNFDGFFYDLDNNVGNESLRVKLDSYSDRTIDIRDLIYTTIPEEVSFNYSAFGKYQVIGFMAEKYFTGYTAGTSSDISSTPISTINSKQLHKILIDDRIQRVVSNGSTLALKDGYILKIKDIDITGRIILLSLS